MSTPSPKPITMALLAEEPFRLFFPLAVFAGMVGVALWPLHLLGITPLYPGPSHGRLMAHGFFGGFILGFMGTALPRLVSAPRFTGPEVAGCLAVYLAMIIAHAVGNTFLGDALFMLLAVGILLSGGWRLVRRQDVPPPGFVLVPLALACGIGGALIALLETRAELPFFWVQLRPLIQYQGFVLLPILGVGGYVLPRFLDLPNPHNFPESRHPPSGWWRRASGAISLGLVILATFAGEALGWPRTAHALRLAVCVVWLVWEVPVHMARARQNPVAWGVRTATALILLGFLAEILWPGYRVALLHLVLMGGLAVLTLAVATRVVYGHSGQRSLLAGPNRWFKAAVWIMLIGMVSRVSGDFWPAIMKSHYIYGALLWLIGAGLWAWHVLPKVRTPDPED